MDAKHGHISARAPERARRPAPDRVPRAQAPPRPTRPAAVRLAYEDCEEIVDEALFTWYLKLLTAEGVRDDHAFCSTVVRSRAVERLRRSTIPTVELSAAADTPDDVAVDELIAEREEIRQLHEIARRVLHAREYTILQLAAQGTRRAAIAEQFGLSVRQVKRVLDDARTRLRRARTRLDEQGRCVMVAAMISEIKTGAIDAADPRRTAAAEHMARCWRCRGSWRLTPPREVRA